MIPGVSRGRNASRNIRAELLPNAKNECSRVTKASATWLRCVGQLGRVLARLVGWHSRVLPGRIEQIFWGA